jgi:predicted DNA-binding ribbon-helix-helix protein
MRTPAEYRLRSSIAKRTVVIRGHKTSVSLEDAFWTSLKEIAVSRESTRSGLLDEINGRRQVANLSSAIRLFVLQFYKERASPGVR